MPSLRLPEGEKRVWICICCKSEHLMVFTGQSTDNMPDCRLLSRRAVDILLHAHDENRVILSSLCQSVECSLRTVDLYRRCKPLRLYNQFLWTDIRAVGCSYDLSVRQDRLTSFIVIILTLFNFDTINSSLSIPQIDTDDALFMDN